MRSLTWDRGTELAAHCALTIATDVHVYFCEPRVRGNVGRTKTQTACCANIYRRLPTCPATAKRSLMRSRYASTLDPE